MPKASLCNIDQIISVAPGPTVISPQRTEPEKSTIVCRTNFSVLVGPVQGRAGSFSQGNSAMNKLLMAVAAVALIAGTSAALA
jgi:hypothetical protein